MGYQANISNREIFKAIKSYCDADVDLAKKYALAKKIIRVFSKSAFYEVSTRCNLFCEGCYYFENSANDGPPLDHNRSLDEWREFFQDENERGVNLAYFVGAEPALHQDRLKASVEQFPFATVGTNGTVKLHEDIPYRICVSVWATDEPTDVKLRGASALKKALRLYSGDKRTIMLFTASRWNLHQTRDFAEICADHGLDATFNIYSPTHAFNQKLKTGTQHYREYFRESTDEDSPSFREQDLPELRETLGSVAEDYPDTVIYSQAYNDWVTQPGSVYQLDENGIALDCASRIQGRFQYFKTDLKPAQVKCCTPDTDCSTCRMYSGGWSSKFMPTGHDVATKEKFSEWLDMMHTINRIFLWPQIT